MKKKARAGERELRHLVKVLMDGGRFCQLAALNEVLARAGMTLSSDDWRIVYRNGMLRFSRSWPWVFDWAKSHGDVVLLGSLLELLIENNEKFAKCPNHYDDLASAVVEYFRLAHSDGLPPLVRRALDFFASQGYAKGVYEFICRADIEDSLSWYFERLDEALIHSSATSEDPTDSGEAGEQLPSSLVLTPKQRIDRLLVAVRSRNLSELIKGSHEFALVGRKVRQAVLNSILVDGNCILARQYAILVMRRRLSSRELNRLAYAKLAIARKSAGNPQKAYEFGDAFMTVAGLIESGVSRRALGEFRQASAELGQLEYLVSLFDPTAKELGLLAEWFSRN